MQQLPYTEEEESKARMKMTKSFVDGDARVSLASIPPFLWVQDGGNFHLCAA